MQRCLRRQSSTGKRRVSATPEYKKALEFKINKKGFIKWIRKRKKRQ